MIMLHEFIEIKAISYHFATDFDRVLLQLVDILNTRFMLTEL